MFRHRFIAMSEDCKICDRDVLSALAEAWGKGAKKLHPYQDTLQTLVRAKDDNWRFWEAFYDLCSLHGLGDSPHILRDAFRAAAQKEEESTMSLLIRMEALALPLVGVEDSGVPSLKSALKEVVGRVANQTNRARLQA